MFGLYPTPVRGVDHCEPWTGQDRRYSWAPVPRERRILRGGATGRGHLGRPSSALEGLARTPVVWPRSFEWLELAGFQKAPKAPKTWPRANPPTIPLRVLVRRKGVAQRSTAQRERCVKSLTVASANERVWSALLLRIGLVRAAPSVTAPAGHAFFARAVASLHAQHGPPARTGSVGGKQTHR